MTSVTASSFTSPDFDSHALEFFLRGAIDGLSGPMMLERISGGQSNPTFFVTFGTTRLVLRKQPPGKLLPSAHAIDREFKVMSALAQSDVPVPETVLYCDDRTVIGTPFYMMRRVEGRVFHDSALAAAPREDRRDMYRSLATSLAALHNVNPERVGLGDYGKHRGYFNRQIARWSRQWQLSRQQEDANIDLLVEWLPHNVPQDDLCAISHGDYRVGNVMFDAASPYLAAILDWELSTLGHPLADLAHCCIAWYSAPDEYGGIKGLDFSSRSLPSQAEFEAWYYAKAKHEARLEPFHMAFALFRFAVVFEGIAARAKAGNAADPDAAKLAYLARVFAGQAVRFVA